MSEPRQGKNFFNRIIMTLKNYDWLILVIVGILLLFGLIMLYSTSSYSAQKDNKNELYYVIQQLRSIGIGIFVLFVFSILPRELLRKLSFLAFAFSIVLVLLVKTPLGSDSHGAVRWLDFGFIRFQPSEMVKITLIIFTAFLICKYSSEQEKKKQEIKIKNSSAYLTKKEARELEQLKVTLRKDELIDYLKTLAATFVGAGAVVVITDDLGTGIIILAIGLVMIVATYKNKKILGITVLVMLGLGVAMVFVQNYRVERIQAWLHPEAYASGTSYQIVQGLYAIGSGGVLGKGLGMSTQKLGFVPESQNDMIFSIICEELGIVGGIVLIILFAALIYRMKVIFDRTENIYDRMVIAGIMTHITAQTFINIGVVTGLIPNTGVPLPFISFGGTAVMFQLAEIGLVLGISARNAAEIDKTISFNKKDKRINKKEAYSWR